MSSPKNMKKNLHYNDYKEIYEGEEEKGSHSSQQSHDDIQLEQADNVMQLPQYSENSQGGCTY